MTRNGIRLARLHRFRGSRLVSFRLPLPLPGVTSGVSGDAPEIHAAKGTCILRDRQGSVCLTGGAAIA